MGISGEPPRSEGSGVRSVHRALGLLTLLGPGRDTATLSQFTQLSGLATSTVQRLLQTLEGEHFLRRLPDGRYTFGVSLIQLGVSALGGNELYALSQTYLDLLSERSGETANLGISDEAGRVVYIRQALSPRSVRHVSWLGRPFAAENTSMGLALKGACNEHGYVSMRNNPLEKEVTGVAAPVYDADEQIIAGLNITGPSYRISDRDLSRFGALVAAAARELSLRCGGRWPHGNGNGDRNRKERGRGGG